MKFRLLDAEILTFEGRSPGRHRAAERRSARSLPQAGDVAIKRKMLCSLAHVHLGQPHLADQELQKRSSLPNPATPAWRERCFELEASSNHAATSLPMPTIRFRASLDIAQEQKDQFLEASDLLNLGWLALHAEHNDEALDWFHASSQIARSIQARVLLESDLGNIGWAYYKLGDYEKALTNFQQAEEQARSLGAPVPQINWLNNAGLSLYQLGDLKGAEDYYRKALSSGAVHRQ